MKVVYLDHNDGQFFRAMEWFFQATIEVKSFSMVLTTLDHHHWMFFEGPTIGFNGFSMVFKILRAMVNDGFDVNDGLDVPLNLKSA